MFLNEQVGTGEKQLNEYSAFLCHHNTVLNKIVLKTPFILIEENDEGVKNILRNANKDAIRKQNNTSIGINFSCAEEGISTMDLIQSDNKCLTKTIAVFAQLCIEVRELCKEGNHHLTNCLFANEELKEISENDEENDQLNIEVSPVSMRESNHNKTDTSPLSINVMKKMNSFLGLFFRTQQFVERCFVVISEIIKQLTALFDADKSNYINVDYSSLHFQTVFNYLAEAVGLIIKCDSVFQASQLQNIWCLYVNAFLGNSQLSQSNITGFESLLTKIGHLLTGHLFQNILDSICQQTKFRPTQALPQFSAQFQSFLRNNLSTLQKNIALSQSRNTFSLHTGSTQTITENDANETLLTLIEETALVDLAVPLVKLNSMCILYHHLFGNLDRKLFTTVIDTNKKLPYIRLIESVIWSPEAFLNKFGSTLLIKYRGRAEKVSAHDIQNTQKQWLQSKCQRLSKEIQLYTTQVAIWVLNFRNEFDCYLPETGHTHSNLKFIKTAELYRKALLILQGIDLAEKFSTAVNAITNLHAHIKHPITKKSILHVCKLTELMKLIKLTMEKYATEINHTTLCLSQHQIYQALQIISNVKKQFQSNSSTSHIYNERAVDILSSLELSQLSLLGSPNIKSILLARLSLTMADPKQLFQADQLNKICRLFVSIERLIDLSDTMKTLSSESYMYWHHDVIIPIYLRDIIQVNKSDDCENIQYLFESITDYYSELMGRSLQFQRDKRIVKLSKNIGPILNELIISKVCGVIETKLRLHVHEDLLLQTEPISLSKACNSNLTIPIRGANRMLALKMIQLFRLTDGENIKLSRYWNARDRVTKYLNAMFYNLTTISMHDWRTYGQMRILAKQKFNLETVDPTGLPTQTIEQGLDVLEIMRNIHLFVSNYVYNLNNQIFIEKNSKNKHLNTINIRHIANSLRTHGIGIINTTVNFIYQFLHKKFYTFSQFLYNEHIQSRLLKDYKSFYDGNLGRAEDQQIYSFERANNLNKGIRQLGLKNGLSPLDLFRELITHIGNAIAYVRMIRSGGIHCCSNASVFLAVTDAKLPFEELCKKYSIPDTTRRSALNIENEIKHLHHNYAESTEYFRMLVKAFSPFFQNNKNPHLKLFYLIVPALILNYIEYIVSVKDSVTKKTKDYGCFTDDGFAMGLTYVLFLLNQITDFSSLNWFEAVRQKFSKELDQLEKARDENSYSQTEDKKLQQTIALSEKRINFFLHEFELLNCSLNSAKVFFQ